MLELPPTLRFPFPHELSHRADLESLSDPLKSPQFAEGYRLLPNLTHPLPFSFSAEININNSRLWDLVLALAAHLPPEICCEYGLKEEEGRATGYFPKNIIIQRLSVFQKELTQDGFLWFSLLSLRPGILLEIRISPTKYLQCSLIDSKEFINCMRDFNLPERSDLVFRDEFPIMVEPLKLFFSDARSPGEVIAKLDQGFQLVS